MVCELVFQTLASCPGVKMLPAFLTSKFSGHMEGSIFILRSCSEVLCKFPGTACAAGLCVQISRGCLCCAFCFVQCQLQPLSFYRGGLGTENSNYAPWICSVQWFSVFCQGVRWCLWRLLQFFKLECFPVGVSFSGEWSSAGAQRLDSSCSEGTQVMTPSLTLLFHGCVLRCLWNFLNRAS